MIFNFQSVRHTVEGKRCKFFYDLLLQKKVQRPCNQNIMSKNFNITDRILWKNVYQTKVKFIDDPLMSEFNYKLHKNLLSNNLFLSKWKNTSPFCTACSYVIENTKHFIFECTNERKIRNIIETVLNFDIQWKHILIGFCLEFNDKVNLLNKLISFIACRI